jgi:hypothetical protein
MSDTNSILESEDFSAYYQAANKIIRDYSKKRNKLQVLNPLIRIFRGGHDSNQYIAIIMAITDCKRALSVEYIDNDSIKEYGFSEKDIVDWLLDCDIHFIITHIHQGLDQCKYNMAVLYKEILRLRNHPGFPNNDYLECPIFTQDKYKYLEVLSEGGFCNPTMKVMLNPDHDYKYLYEDIKR